MSKLVTPAVARIAAIALFGVGAPAIAQVLVTGDEDFGLNRPPSLLEYATDQAQLFSSATAVSTYAGSRRAPAIECNESFAFWSCREEFDGGDVFTPGNRVTSETTGSNIVSAQRDAFDFPRTDFGQAESRARAAADFGKLRAEAYAANSYFWEETRVLSSEVPDTRTITGSATALAFATSRSTEVLTPTADGSITLQFSVTQHPASFSPPYSNFPIREAFEGFGGGALDVQVFNLDSPVIYLDGERDVEGFELVGQASDGRDTPGTTFFDLTLNLVGGQRYSIISQLFVEAQFDAAVDFFGTASLDRILIEPGQVLAFGSGTAYDIALVPVPAALPMLLGGLGLLGVASRRRRGAATGG
jgi:hypothetical protein